MPIPRPPGPSRPAQRSRPAQGSTRLYDEYGGRKKSVASQMGGILRVEILPARTPEGSCAASSIAYSRGPTGISYYAQIQAAEVFTKISRPEFARRATNGCRATIRKLDSSKVVKGIGFASTSDGSGDGEFSNIRDARFRQGDRSGVKNIPPTARPGTNTCACCSTRLER